MKKIQYISRFPRCVVGGLTAAGSTSAGAATVQITFANNVVFNTGGGGMSNFSPDLTGDGVADLVARVSYKTALFSNVRGGRLGMGYKFQGGTLLASIGGVVESSIRSNVGFRGLAVVSFTDRRINGGALTNGHLDISASASSASQSARIHRLIFNNSSTAAPVGVAAGGFAYPEFVAIPEPSSLGLLALGAGGLLTRRRRDKVAA